MRITTFPRLFAVAGTLVVCWLLWAAPTVSAHTVLVQTTPESGALLSAAPAEVSLKFTQQPLSGSVALVAESANGSTVQLGQPAVEATTVTAAWPAGQPSGTYRVSWRVVSPDGHPVNGTWEFSYAVSSAQPFVTATPEAQPSSSASSFPWLVVGIIVVVAIGLIAIFTIRRKSR